MWVARDKDGALHVFWNEPRKDKDAYLPITGDTKTPFMDIMNHYKDLSFYHGARRCTLFRLLYLSMGVTITSKNAKYPKGMKLASKIVSYLFEERYGELGQMPKKDLEVLKEACLILQKQK